MPSVPASTLNNGQTIPQFGLGVFQASPEDTAAAVADALEAGYRHIDTAEGYRNEAGVGEGVRRSGLDRSEGFVTSKLNNDSHLPADARAAFDTTLKTLGFDYVDLFDFELSPGDIEDITMLNKNERTGGDPDKFPGIGFTGEQAEYRYPVS